MPPLTAKVVGVAVVVGILVVFLSWWAGPSLFGSVDGAAARTVEATVTRPSDCSTNNAEETVRFELAGDTRDGTLSGCGHDQDERVQVSVPAEAGAGPVDVHLANTELGTSDLRRPVGLALLVLSCAGGGMYAFLVVRGPRHSLPVAS